MDMIKTTFKNHGQMIILSAEDLLLKMVTLETIIIMQMIMTTLLVTEKIIVIAATCLLPIMRIMLDGDMILFTMHGNPVMKRFNLAMARDTTSCIKI